MKRYGNLFEQIISIENLTLADNIARKGKRNQPQIRDHIKDEVSNIQKLHLLLKNKQYRTSEYSIFTVFEPKERQVYRLPYYPDRIVHHAIMNVLEPIFVSRFPRNTYSCIKTRGIHAAARTIRSYLSDVPGTMYCLKLDIKKFYPSVNHEILKQQLRSILKDPDLLELLDEIIDSENGLPIGNYLSQYFSNFYLVEFDNWLKRTMRVKYYLRYADDIVVLSTSKHVLHALLHEIRTFLSTNLKLTVKENYQVFAVSDRGIDFVGYKFYHTHTLLRKGIKMNFKRMISRRPTRESIASYYGWAVHADTKHLLKKILTDDQLLRLRNNPRKRRIRGRKNKNECGIKP